jgi:hypothetical protein
MSVRERGKTSGERKNTGLFALPEVDQQEKSSAVFRRIVVHFENREAMEMFSTLMGQKIMMSTKAIWFKNRK